MTRPGRGAAAVTVEHVDGGGGVAAVVGVEEVRPLRGQHAGHNNLLTGNISHQGRGGGGQIVDITLGI